MTITIERELDAEELFNDMVADFADYGTCDDAGLTDDDFTPEVLADIFNELAIVAAKRAGKMWRE